MVVKGDSLEVGLCLGLVNYVCSIVVLGERSLKDGFNLLSITLNKNIIILDFEDFKEGRFIQITNANFLIHYEVFKYKFVNVRFKLNYTKNMNFSNLSV